jgi:hypothetical protein
MSRAISLLLLTPSCRAQGYNHPASSSVDLHVLILRNLSVLSSANIISQITLHLKIFFVLFHQAITVYRFLFMDAKLKIPCTVSLCNLNTTYHFLGRRMTARYINYSNSQFKSTLFIHTVLNWLTIQIPYSLLHAFNRQDLNTLTLLANLLIATSCIS